jgi:hypothetical protein
LGCSGEEAGTAEKGARFRQGSQGRARQGLVPIQAVVFLLWAHFRRKAPETGLSACIFCRLRRQKDTASIPCAAQRAKRVELGSFAIIGVGTDLRSATAAEPPPYSGFLGIRPPSNKVLRRGKAEACLDTRPFRLAGLIR